MAYIKGQFDVTQHVDSNGDPAASYILKFFVWNTSTPTAVYSDSSGTSAGTEITLNSLGQPQSSGGTAIDLFFDDAVTYKAQLYQSGGATTVGPVIGPFTVGSTSSGITYTPAGTGADDTTVQAKLRERVSIKDFGAVLDGATDDATAIQEALNYAKSLEACTIEFPCGVCAHTAVSLTNATNITLESTGGVLYDLGVSDDDSDLIGTLRRFNGITFTACKDIKVKGFVLQSNTDKGGNGVIKNSVNYSNHIRFYQCTNVTVDDVALDYRNDHPDSAYRAEATFTDDLMRSFPLYFDESDNVRFINCGVADTNDTGEIIAFRECDGVSIVRPYTMKGSGVASNHSSLGKVIGCDNVVIEQIRANTAYNGSLFDVSGTNITVKDSRIDMPQGGLVDVTREWGPAGGDIEMVTLENLSTTGKNLISTADASSVLEANTGTNYNTNVNKIKRVRIVNCETSDDTHPFSDKRSGVNHAINSKDVQQVELIGYERRIKNPEDICMEISNNTAGDTSIDYDYTVRGYEYYQDENAQSYSARIDVCGTARLYDVKFMFSATVATANKSDLAFRDTQLINGEAGVTADNTKSKIYCYNCHFENCTITLQANVDFIACTFRNCIILDSGIDNNIYFDRDCRATLIDTSDSLVATDPGAECIFIHFETIREIDWNGTIDGEYVKPGSGTRAVIASIVSNTVFNKFVGCRFDVEARSSTGGAATADNLILHWDRNDNNTYIEGLINRKSLMVPVKATAAAASTSAKLEILDCDTRGNLIDDSGTFTNSTLYLVKNKCNATNQTGTWTTTQILDNSTGLS